MNNNNFQISDSKNIFETSNQNLRDQQDHSPFKTFSQFKVDDQTTNQFKNPAEKKNGIIEKIKKQASKIFNLAPGTDQIGGTLKEQSEIQKQNSQNLDALEDALEFFNKNGYKKHEQNGEYSDFSFFEPNITFRQYNISLYFYLQFLKCFFLFLLALCIPTLIRMTIHYTVFDGFIDSGFSGNMQVGILKFSVGNISNPSLTMFGVTLGCEVVTILMIMGFIIYWHAVSKQTLEWFQTQIPQPNRYVVSISGFPKNENGTTDMDVQIIKNILPERQLYDVVPIYDLDGQMPTLMKLQELKTAKQDQINKQEEQKKIQKQKQMQKQKQKQKEKEKQNEKTKEKQKQKQDQNSNEIINDLNNQIICLEKDIFIESEIFPLKAIYCILHFKKRVDRQCFLNKYLDTYHIDTCLGKSMRCLTSKKQPDQLKYKQKSQLLIRDLDLPCPDDILWENMQVSKCKKLYLRIIGLITLPIVTFGMGLVVSLMSQQLNKLVKQRSCSGFGELNKNYILTNTDNLDLVYCYCLQRFPDFTDICINKTEFTKEIILSMMCSAATSVLSSIANCILAYIIPILVSYTKHSTKSRLQSTSFWVSTIATVINSLFLPLIFSLQFNGISFSSILHYYIGSSFNGKNIISFPDLTRDWYMYATPFYFSYLLNSIVISLLQIAQYAIPNFYAFFKIAKLTSSSVSRTLNQQTLSQFNIQSNLSLLSVNLFIILSYSSQQPFLIVMGCILMGIQYFSHKTIVLKYCKQIPFQKQQMNNKILSLLSITLLIRCIFACWCYTVPEMFQKQLFRYTNMWSYTLTQISYVMQRFFEIGILSVLTIIVSLVIIFDYFFVGFYRAAIMFLPCWRRKIVQPEKIQQQQKNYDQRIQALQKDRPQFSLITSYRIQDNTTYSKCWKMVQEYRQKRMQEFLSKKKGYSFRDSFNQFSDNVLIQGKNTFKKLKPNKIVPIIIRKIKQQIPIFGDAKSEKQQQNKKTSRTQRSSQFFKQQQPYKLMSQSKNTSQSKYQKQLKSSRQDIFANIKKSNKRETSPQEQFQLAMTNVDSFMKKSIKIVGKLQRQIQNLKSQNASIRQKNSILSKQQKIKKDGQQPKCRKAQVKQQSQKHSEQIQIRAQKQLAQRQQINATSSNIECQKQLIPSDLKGTGQTTKASQSKSQDKWQQSKLDGHV